MPISDVALIVASAGGLGGLAALITSFRGRHTQKAIRDNVVNDHDTFLRNDVDDIQETVDKVLEGQDRIFRFLEKQDDKITSNNRRVDHGLGEVQRLVESETEERRRDVDMLQSRLDEGGL